MTRKNASKGRRKTIEQDAKQTQLAAAIAASSSDTAQPVQAVSDGHDITFHWLVRDHGPQWETWRGYMAAYVEKVHEGRAGALSAVRLFCLNYLLEANLPPEPDWLLNRRQRVPEFRGTMAATRHIERASYHIHRFLNWVLETHFSEPDDYGRPVVLQTFHNPIPCRPRSRSTAPTESVRSPLPYIYIRRLREILAPGTNFGDWKWAQTAVGIELDANGRAENGGARTGDWFEVNPAVVDPEDPDCIVRTRVVPEHFDPKTPTRTYTRKTITEMWSPVRSVALLTKLHLPLRTMQVRMLDSGEADTLRYESSGRTGPRQPPLGPGELPSIDWKVNVGPLALGDEAHPIQRGVFRRIEDREHRLVLTGLYVNTNKTADAGKEGSGKGYVIPWQHDELLYWLEKLRNWQQKYNPISAPVKWVSLTPKHTGGVKSPEVLARYADSCFLFRHASRKGKDRTMPIPGGAITRLWFELLETLEREESANGTAYGDGTPIRFVVPALAGSCNQGAMLFPIHSLRVSLLTCLALDGGVPLPVLSKLVAGHSRLMMTLYYTKIGPTRLAEEISAARARLEANAPEGLRRFLAEASLEQLAEKLVALDMDSVRTVLGERPADRSPAGWALMPEGWCLAGGNTSPTSNRQLPGCHNGGPILVSHKSDFRVRVYSPVHGGPRNCVCCRWFVAAPQFIPRLMVRFNGVSYQLSEATSVALAAEGERDALARERYRTMREGSPWTREAEFLDLEARVEKAFASVDQHGITLAHAYRLIIRCLALIESAQTEGQQLVAVGDVNTLRAAFKETDSRLLQINQICEDTEIHPDTDPAEAVFVRAQLIDNALIRDGFRPVMLTLTKDQQLKIGNRLIRDLANQFDPTDPDRGMEQVVRAIEAGSSLADMGLTTDVAEAIQNVTGGPVLRLEDLAGPLPAIVRQGRRAALFGEDP